MAGGELAGAGDGAGRERADSVGFLAEPFSEVRCLGESVCASVLGESGGRPISDIGGYRASTGVRSWPSPVAAARKSVNPRGHVVAAHADGLRATTEPRVARRRAPPARPQIDRTHHELRPL